MERTALLNKSTIPNDVVALAADVLDAAVVLALYAGHAVPFVMAYTYNLPAGRREVSGGAAGL